MLTDEQKQLRRLKVGGSDIPKLLGISKYGNAMDCYLRIVEGLDDEWNPMMERGAAVEPELRGYGQNFLKLELDSPESDYHDHPTLEWARAQIDDLARREGMPVVVDYKSVSRWAKGWGAPGTDDVPENIRAQLAWEMACADRDLGVLVVGFGEDAPPPVIFHVSNVVHYEVERCPVFESYCIAVATDFWNQHVLPRVPPSMKQLGKKKVKS